MAALNTVADRITPPETVESASRPDQPAQVSLKAGVDESTVDYNDGGQELWTTASWTSGNRAILSVTESNSAIFAPYKATVTMPRNDTTVTLTLKLVYNGREDLTVTKVYTILFKGTDSPRPVDYQALLETTLRETGLTNPATARPSTPAASPRISSSPPPLISAPITARTITRISTASIPPFCCAPAMRMWWCPPIPPWSMWPGC